jgi:hypothetical protein
MATLFLVLMLPFSVFAAGRGVTRRDGFLLIWEGIRRPALETTETPFMDIGEGDRGEAEITYAEARGILDADERFQPDDSLSLADALLWLFRTRNVDDLDVLTPAGIPELLKRYPIADPTGNLTQAVSVDEVLSLAQGLDDLLAKEVHEVSLYSEEFHGQGTAFGEVFDMNALTAAHRTLPQNTLVRVTNVENGMSVIVRINDRGPYVAGRDMDLSLAAFTSIAPRGQGILRATFERLGDSSLVGACGTVPHTYQRRIMRDVHLNRGIPNLLSIGETVTLSSIRPFVVRSVMYPDGTLERFEDWVLPGEIFTLTPSQPGTYLFLLSTADGRRREMRTEVWQCSANPTFP